MDFRGNRLIILFENGASVFFMSGKMTGVQSNSLLKSVLHDLKVPQFLAGTKALGLLSRIITEPLWCLIEDKQINILVRHSLSRVVVPATLHHLCQRLKNSPKIT